MVSGGTSIAAAHITGIASVLWGLNPQKPADFIRQLLDESGSQTEIMKEQNCSLVDLNYAIKSYNDYESIYWIKKDSILGNRIENSLSTDGTSVSENTVFEIDEASNSLPEMDEQVLKPNNGEIIQFEEPEYVEGMWNQTGVHETDAGYYGSSILTLTADEIRVLKSYAAYPDSHFNNIASLNGGGNANYVASLRYLFLAAVNIKNGKSIDGISFKDQYVDNQNKLGLVLHLDIH